MNGLSNANSLDDIKKTILDLKIASKSDKKAIETMYKFKKLSEARMDEQFKSKYDLSVGKLKSNLLHPIVVNDKIVDR